MTKYTKRVDELEVGDIVKPPYSRSILTIKSVEQIAERAYQVVYQELETIPSYDVFEDFTYLGKKKEKLMNETNINKLNSRLEALEKLCSSLHLELFKPTKAKIDCSALYFYFDLLAKEEATFQHANTPVYVRQQLKNIHELFEDVLELTLVEVKTLYFERKMSRSSLDKEDDSEFTTKKAKELCIGDKVVISTKAIV